MFASRAWAVIPAFAGTLAYPPPTTRGSSSLVLPQCLPAVRRGWGSRGAADTEAASPPARARPLPSLPSTHLVGLPARLPTMATADLERTVGPHRRLPHLALTLCREDRSRRM